MDILLPVASWNANICNYELNSQYPMPNTITKHETMKGRMFEQAPNDEHLEQWKTSMTSHNFDNDNTNNNNNDSKSSPFAYRIVVNRISIRIQAFFVTFQLFVIILLANRNNRT